MVGCAILPALAVPSSTRISARLKHALGHSSRVNIRADTKCDLRTFGTAMYTSHEYSTARSRFKAWDIARRDLRVETLEDGLGSH